MSGIIAEVQSGVLVRSFVIAALVVSPFAALQWKRRRDLRAAERAAAEASVLPPPPPRWPPLEDVIAEIDSTCRMLRDGTAEGTRASVVVPGEVSIDGDRAPDELIEALLADALRRNGARAVASVPLADGRRIDLQLADEPSSRPGSRPALG